MTIEDFRALTPDERRVAIAKDALAQKQAGKLCPESGVFVGSETLYQRHVNTELQAAIQEETWKCEACAIGGLFLGIVHLSDNFKINSKTVKYKGVPFKTKVFNGFMERLLKYFSLKQIALIEAAFEGEPTQWSVDRGIYLSAVESVKAQQFYIERPDPSERFDEICYNIITNEGTFIP